MAVDIGLKAATSPTPKINATTSGGARNCQIDTPAERATASSSRRDRLRNAAIAPISTTKGRACSATIGVCSNASQAIDAAGRRFGFARAPQGVDKVQREDQRRARRRTPRARRGRSARPNSGRARRGSSARLDGAAPQASDGARGGADEDRVEAESAAASGPPQAPSRDHSGAPAAALAAQGQRIGEAEDADRGEHERWPTMASRGSAGSCAPRRARRRRPGRPTIA